MEAPPELALAQMDYVGVDVAVLHNQNFYGFLNDYIAEAVQRYPNRFIGLAQVHEEEAHTPGQIEELRRSVLELGLRGLYFAPGNHDHNPNYLEDPKFTPFWDIVRDLGIVAYLSINWRKVAAWAQRYPEVQIITGFPGVDLPREGSIRIPEALHRYLSQPNILLEICPIGYGARYEYPYTEMQAYIRPLYDAYGGSKFVWGSDLPNLERWCTYMQGLDFLRRHCTFISKPDMELILGGNLAKVYGLEAPTHQREAQLSSAHA
jgi:predicted TIM-barrel fold metal-dependent hydrolase